MKPTLVPQTQLFLSSSHSHEGSLHTGLAALLCAFSLVAFGGVVTMAQNVQHTENNADLSLKSDLRVDPSTLGMSISIPLASYSGRAGHGLPVTLNYSSKSLRLAYRGMDLPPISGSQTWTNLEFVDHTTAGWTSTLGAPRVEFTGMQQFYDSLGRPGCEECVPGRAIVGDHYVKRIHVHLPDGSSHELRLDDQVYAIPVQPFTGVFHSVDGSRMRFESNAGSPSVLHLPDGSRYVFPAYNSGGDLTATSYEDRHGNKLDYTYDPVMKRGHWTDTLGRVLTDPLPREPGDGDTTEFRAKLVGGTQEAVYTFHWKRLGDVVTPDPATGVRPEVKYPGSQKCAPNSYQTVTDSPLYLSSGDTKVCVEKDENGNALRFDPVVLAEVVLPTGNTYSFTYTVNGEIERVHLPTGGTESFTYAQVAPLSHTSHPYHQTNRGVVERRASAGGGAAESVWSYSVPSSNPYTVRTTSPDGTYGERLLHRSRYTGVGDNISRFGFDTALTGMIYEERAFDATGVMLRRSLSKWAEAGPLPGGDIRAARGPKVTKQVSVVLDAEGANALWSATVSRYEQASEPLNQTSATEYGYDSSMSKSAAQMAAVDTFATPDSLAVRTTVTEYLEDVAYSARGLTALPLSVVVTAGTPSGAVVSRVETSYDESSFPLLPCGATVGRNDPGTAARANATTVRRRLDPGGTWLETHAQYDACGNARKAWDAKDAALQNPSLTDYSPAYQSAYPTSSTSADPDGSGPAAALVTTIAYDFSTGRVTSTTDANNQTTTFHYTDEESGTPDKFNRLHTVVRPGGLQAGGGGQTAYSYGETPGNLHVRTRTYFEAARFTEAYQYFDGLARPLRSIVYENQNPAKPWLTSDTEYDTLGRVRRASLPYRAAGGAAMFSTDKWTETEYDALGRVRTVTTKPDNASVKTDYSGDRVLVTDQAGKQRVSRVDALGRLLDVWEVRSSDPASGTEAVTFPARAGVPAVSAGYRTSYAYDVLANLRTVSQGAQTRTFVYDSLSRLTSAANPESGTVTYTYDANGNLQTRTDARGVTATYTYDGLNRNKTITYAGGGTSTPAVSRHYDNPAAGANGLGRAWKSEAAGVSRSTTSAYDAAGRPTSYSQQFWSNGAWGTAFTGSLEYDLSSNVTKQTYPSGHSVTYAYDAAGRLGDAGGRPAFKGNLGDGVERTYASEVRYHELGGMEQERFGTQTPLYNKHFFNSRGQMSNVRLSTYSITTPGEDGNWNRGAIVNHYSNQSWAGSGTDNNGNLLKQELYLPHDNSVSAYTQMAQHYSYDELNRLKSVTEFLNNQTQSFRQSYSYDRFGNRTIDAAATFNAPEPQFSVGAAGVGVNRLGVPAGQAGAMQYDAVGNLTNDTYQGGQGGGGTRVYDAEGRMTQAQFVSGQLQTAVYAYDADGRRVRRKIGAGAEVWQVYGVGGELLAEYAASAAPSTPQKEYGYRAGELLITASPGSSASTGPVAHWRFDDNAGAAATDSSGGGHAGTLNGTTWSAGHTGASSASFDGADDYVQVGPNNSLKMTSQMTASAWIYPTGAGSEPNAGGIIICREGEYEVARFPDGTVRWAFANTTPGWNWVSTGYVAPLNQWTHVTVTYDQGVVKTYANGALMHTHNGTGSIGDVLPAQNDFRVGGRQAVSQHFAGRIDEVRLFNRALPASEAVAEMNPTNSRSNVALSSNGGAASASSTHSSAFPVVSVNNGERRGAGWNGGEGGWNDATPNAYPDWVQVEFAGPKAIDEIGVITLQDNLGNLQEPTEAMTFSLYGTTAFYVQYWDGSQWVTVQGGSVSGNNRVWRKFTFPAVLTTKVRVVVNAALASHSRIVEVEVWGVNATTDEADIRWLVSDHLGTPRMVVDQTGSLSGVKRHDHLPFGEVIGSGIGGRTTALGHGVNNVRQKFTGYERDEEAGLDFAEARYYGSTQGRFTGVDPLLSSGSVYDPQTWNRYSYALNNPLKYVDPLGLYVFDKSVTEEQRKRFNAALSQARENLKKIGEIYGTDSDEYKKAQRALDSYGEEGVKNGVTIFAQEGVGAGRVGVEGVAGQKTKDNPTGQNIRAIFDPDTFDSRSFSTLIGHEGNHVADSSDWVKSNFALSKNPTLYQTEFDSYLIQGLFAEVLVPNSYAFLTLPSASAGKGKNPYAPDFVYLWDSGWEAADKATLRRANIDRFLARPKNAGGSYGITSASRERAFTRGARF